MARRKTVSVPVIGPWPLEHGPLFLRLGALRPQPPSPARDPHTGLPVDRIGSVLVRTGQRPVRTRRP
ncbi:hypothetical protein ADK41_29340 [Streptomyces caelestis]|uniref:Uncharacterized protein n=1 Tax=Streptomyces caelestis TaxID=36816 RepID=A0A0M8QKZ2_9ACTN|nr:hypothetical protein ADK41_29340 [Streptomyces caelestis]KOV29240.1 hypothetical protein ADK58_09940 [Streptomyces sp. XY152]